LPRRRRNFLLENLTNDEAAQYLALGWYNFARDEQLPPPGDWRIWLFLGGRGAGKTRAGAEWIAEGVGRGVMRDVGRRAPPFSMSAVS
jgi:phage terminase large subunit-like protein